MQSSRMGKYALLPDVTCHERPVYTSADGTKYLYFWGSIRKWIIGPNYENSSGWITSPVTDAADADLVPSGNWQIGDGKEWKTDPALKTSSVQRVTSEGKVLASLFVACDGLGLEGKANEIVSTWGRNVRHRWRGLQFSKSGALTHLDLSGCTFLKELPDSINCLAALTQLCLQGCKVLRSLPATITRLSNLTDLNIKGCEVLALPDMAAELGEFATFVYRDCNLKQLERIRRFSKLRATVHKDSGSTEDNVQIHVDAGTVNVLIASRMLSRIMTSVLSHAAQSTCARAVAPEGNLLISTSDACDAFDLNGKGACGVISIAGSVVQSSRMGKYTLLPDVTCYERPVYTSADGTKYLYFWGSIEKWVIGPNYENSSGWITSTVTDAADADLVPSGNWQNWDGKEWKMDPALKISCVQRVMSEGNVLVSMFGACDGFGLKGDVDAKLATWGVEADLSTWNGLEFNDARSITKLDLSSCTSLVLLPDQITSLSNLTHLNISACTLLRSLPDHITGLVNLTELNLLGCHNFVLSHVAGELDNTAEFILRVKGFNVEEVLQRLAAMRQIGPDGIPLVSLFLGLDGLGVKGEVPSIGAGHTWSDTGKFSSHCKYTLDNGADLSTWGVGNSYKGLCFAQPNNRITRLNLEYCKSLTSIPDCIGDLAELTAIDVAHCNNISYVPRSISGLAKLKQVHGSRLFSEKLKKKLKRNGCRFST